MRKYYILESTTQNGRGFVVTDGISFNLEAEDLKYSPKGYRIYALYMNDNKTAFKPEWVRIGTMSILNGRGVFKGSSVKKELPAAIIVTDAEYLNSDWQKSNSLFNISKKSEFPRHLWIHDFNERYRSAAAVDGSKADSEQLAKQALVEKQRVHPAEEEALPAQDVSVQKEPEEEKEVSLPVDTATAETMPLKQSEADQEITEQELTPAGQYLLELPELSNNPENLISDKERNVNAQPEQQVEAQVANSSFEPNQMTLDELAPSATLPGEEEQRGDSLKEAGIKEFIYLMDENFQCCDPFMTNRNDYIWWKVDDKNLLADIIERTAYKKCSGRIRLVTELFNKFNENNYFIFGIYINFIKDNDFLGCGAFTLGIGISDSITETAPIKGCIKMGKKPDYYWIIYIDPLTGNVLSLSRKV